MPLRRHAPGAGVLHLASWRSLRWRGALILGDGNRSTQLPNTTRDDNRLNQEDYPTTALRLRYSFVRYFSPKQHNQPEDAGGPQSVQRRRVV